MGLSKDYNANGLDQWHCDSASIPGSQGFRAEELGPSILRSPSASSICDTHTDTHSSSLPLKLVDVCQWERKRHCAFEIG
jgi:hypothetical protein